MKLLSPEEIDELKQHPAVLKVNEYFLHLTPEFKEWLSFVCSPYALMGLNFIARQRVIGCRKEPKRYKNVP